MLPEEEVRRLNSAENRARSNQVLSTSSNRIEYNANGEFCIPAQEILNELSSRNYMSDLLVSMKERREFTVFTVW